MLKVLVGILWEKKSRGEGKREEKKDGEREREIREGRKEMEDVDGERKERNWREGRKGRKKGPVSIEVLGTSQHNSNKTS